MSSSGTYWKFAVGAGVLMLSYCTYFFCKRKRMKEAKEIHLKDPESCLNFMLQELRLGEKLLAKGRRKTKEIKQSMDELRYKAVVEQLELGIFYLAQDDITKGAQHISVVLTMCSRPERLMTHLRQNLSAEEYQQLISKIPLMYRNLGQHSWGKL